MSTMTEIQALETKMDGHIERQEKFNEVVTENLKKLTEVNADIKVFQAEMNNLANDVREVKESQSRLSDKVYEFDKQAAVFNKFNASLNKIVTTLITSAIVVSASAIGYVVFNLKP